MPRARLRDVLLVVAAATAGGCGPKVYPGPKGPPPEDNSAAAAADGGIAAGAVDDGGTVAAVPPATAIDGGVANVPPPPEPPSLTAALDPALESGLKAAGDKNARGMRPEGPPVAGDLKANEHINANVTLEAGRCYAVVAYSPKGSVGTIKMRLLAPPQFTQAVAEGPILGKGKPLCPIAPQGQTQAYRLDIAAARGAGKIGAQVYSRAK